MAKQAAQKEAADVRKMKKAEVAHQKYKEKEVARHMEAGERKIDIESELESEDPTDVDDMVFSEEKESQEVVVTSAERRDPTATSAGDEQDIVGEWEARGGSRAKEAHGERGHRRRTGGKADAVTAPLGGVAGPIPAYRGRGRAS